MAGLRLVPAGEEAVDRADAPLGGDRQVGPAGRRRARSRRAPPRTPARGSTVVPTAMTRRPARCVALTAAAVAGGTAKRSAYGGSPTSSEETPVCSVSRATPTPRAASACEHARRERPARARHLGAARARGRRASGTRRAGARPGRARSGSARRARRGRSSTGRPPRSSPARHSRGADGRRPASVAVAPPGRARTSPARPSTTRKPSRRSSTSHPGPSRIGRGEVELDPVAVLALGLDRRGDRRRLVDDHEVARPQVRGEVAERPVAQRRAAAGDHQPDGVARQPALLRRRARLERGRQAEVQRRAHAGAPASARAA